MIFFPCVLHVWSKYYNFHWRYFVVELIIIGMCYIHTYYMVCIYKRIRILTNFMCIFNYPMYRSTCRLNSIVESNSERTRIAEYYSRYYTFKNDWKFILQPEIPIYQYRSRNLASTLHSWLKLNQVRFSQNEI